MSTYVCARNFEIFIGRDPLSLCDVELCILEFDRLQEADLREFLEGDYFLRQDLLVG